jgi:hypothetical protein
MEKEVVVIAKIGQSEKIQNEGDLRRIQALLPCPSEAYTRCWIEGDELKAELAEAVAVRKLKPAPHDPGKAKKLDVVPEDKSKEKKKQKPDLPGKGKPPKE